MTTTELRKISLKKRTLSTALTWHAADELISNRILLHYHVLLAEDVNMLSAK